MSHTKMTPAIVIKNKLKDHWADKEIKKAAEEIDGGRYFAPPRTEEEEAVDGMGLALGTGFGGAAVGLKPTLDEFQQTHDLNVLARHPRVQEALDKMKKEIEDDPMSPEALEASWMMHEMHEHNTMKERWPGQERWRGRENEEMRYGQVLEATAFYQRLVEVIGESRVLLGRYAGKIDPDARGAMLGLYRPNPDWDGIETPEVEYVSVQIATLQQDAEKKRTEGLKLKAAKQFADAAKAMREATDMYRAAAELKIQKGVQTFAERASQFQRVGAIQWPYSTEWTLMNFNQWGVPTTHKFYGWRTSLLSMVRNRAITEEEAEEAFPVGEGPAAEWYLQQLWMRRHFGYLDKGQEN